MLTWSLVCMLAATIILGVGFCFAPSKTWAFIIQILILISLVCFGIVFTTFTTGFNLYSILLIAAIIPQFLNMYNPAKLPAKTDTPSENKTVENEQNNQPVQPLENQDEYNLEDQPKKEPKSPKICCSLTNSIAILVSACILGFCGFFWGLEVSYGYLIGLFFAGAITLLLLALKRKFKIADLLSMFFCLLSFGIAIGQIILVLLYSLEIVNIIYCAAALLFGIFSLLACFKKLKFNNILFYISTLCFFSTLIFYAQIF